METISLSDYCRVFITTSLPGMKKQEFKRHLEEYLKYHGKDITLKDSTLNLLYKEYSERKRTRHGKKL